MRVSVLKLLNQGLSRVHCALCSRGGRCGELWTRMSDRLAKFELQVTQEFSRFMAAVGAAYVAVYYLDYVDAEYGLWLTWLLTPLIITFLLPALVFLLIYTSAVIFHIYRLYRLRLVEGVNSDWRSAARLLVCALWDAHGWLWHGYEISGQQNIPDGPCLFIYYHGALPVDMYYFVARMYLLKRMSIHTVADRFMFKIPGWAMMLEGLCVIPGTVQTCSNILRTGNKLGISPGGVYEAQFGDHYYELQWQSRIGFAKVALEAKVPIVPMFTQNVREAFRTVGWLRWLWLRIYQTTRIPLAPVYGGLPVKLVTHLGEPIPYDPTLTPQQLQKKVAKAIEELIEEHQRVPGSILRGLTERVYRVPKNPKKTKSANGAVPNGKTFPLDERNTNDENGDVKHATEQVTVTDAKRNVNYETKMADDGKEVAKVNNEIAESETAKAVDESSDMNNEITDRVKNVDTISKNLDKETGDGDIKVS